jgi:hypothetical protein
MNLVSRRWRNLWKHLQVFNLWADNFETFKKFADFVNTVLALRKSRDIQKLYFSWDYRYLSYQDVSECDCAETWVRDAAGPYLQELTLDMPECYADLSPHLINCTNLVYLR